MRKYFVLLLLVLLMACNSVESEEKGLATIEPLEEFETKKAAERLALGPIFEFDITYHDPENTKVEMWLDIYEDGEKTSGERGQLATEDITIEHKQETLGWAILDPTAETLDIKLYDYNKDGHTTAGTRLPSNLETEYPTAYHNLFNEKKNLKSGEGYAIAAYYQSNEKGTIQNTTSLDKLIQNNRIVYVLNVKVSEK